MTKKTLSMLQPNGSVQLILMHDEQLSIDRLQWLLTTHYSKQESVSQLMKLGHVSRLSEHIEPSELSQLSEEEVEKLPKRKLNQLTKDESKHSVFYSREFGVEDLEELHEETLLSWMRLVKEISVDTSHHYLFMGNQWHRYVNSTVIPI